MVASRALIAAAAVLSAASASAMTVSDGEFSSWSSFSVVTDDPFVVTPGPGTSIGEAARIGSGGNPGAYFGVTHRFSTGDTIWTGGLKLDFAYDPSTSGAIASVALSVDLLHVPSGATAWQLALEQGNQLFYSVPWSAFTANPDWVPASLPALTSGSFATNPWAGYAGIVSDGLHPDFTSNGAPISFGFVFGNRVIGNGTIVNSLGMDNFSLTITPVPEPHQSLLVLLGLAVLFVRSGAWSRWREVRILRY